MEPIDLTLSDDEEFYCHPKRTRTDHGSDSDAEPVEALLPAAEPEASERHHLEDDDPVITKQTGQVWNEHLPHSREQCGVYPFKAINAWQNVKHCSQCYCYICDAPASVYSTWGTDACGPDHCNAHSGSEVFRAMREAWQGASSPHTPAQSAGSGLPTQPQRSTPSQALDPTSAL